MNRGVLQSAPPVQQIMAAVGGPNWWGVNYTRPPAPPQPSFPFMSGATNQNFPSNYDFFPHQYSTPTSSSSATNPSLLLSSASSWHDSNSLELSPHESLSQLLLGGLVGGHHEEGSKLLQGNSDNNGERPPPSVSIVKQERGGNGFLYGGGGDNSELLATKAATAAATPAGWSSQEYISAASSNNSSMLDFSNTKKANLRHPPSDHRSPSESNSSGGGTVNNKRARVQPSPTSAQPPLKVRKEKLGDRITALHQLVSPFGKTDTASVLLEAIGYIRFLQSQIEALSLPYLATASAPCRRHPRTVQGERNCIFPDHPGQLLNENCMKRKGAPEQVYSDEEQPKKDLRSRGLCLVPVSCTLQVGSDNGADYWAPAAL